jgi:hypothetical protein
MTCNWNLLYTRDELLGVMNNNLTIENCADSRQREVLKSSLLESYKISTDIHGTKLWEHGLNLLVTKKNKDAIIKILFDNFDDSDVCHCNIYPNNDLTKAKIAECYDTFNSVWLDAKYFTYSDDEKQKFAENSVDIDFFDKQV